MTAQTFRHFRWLALLLLFAGIAVMFSGGVEQPESATANAPRGVDSTRVSQLQEKVSAQESAGESGQAAIVFFRSDSQLDVPVLQGKADELGGPLIPSKDARAAIVPVQVYSGTATENAESVQQLRDAAKADLTDGVSAQVTGPAAIQADLANVFQGANFLLLSVTAGIVAVLLIVTYRSPILWLLPLLVIGVTDRVASVAFTYVLDAFGLAWDESTAGILSVLVFGAGTNYALLLISRYRDELTRTPDRFTAMARTWLPTLRTVSASAGTVIVGVLCLLLSSVPTTQGLGAAAAVGIFIAWLFAMFALPGVLVAFGRWIFWPRTPQPGSQPDHALWDKIGRLSARKPVAVAAVSLVILAICCLGYPQIKTGLSQSDQFIDTPESISAAAQLEEAFPEQSATPPVVATPADEVARTKAGIDKLGGSTTERGSADGMILLQVSGLDFHQLREEFAGTGTIVGGPDAELADAESAAQHDRNVIFPTVLILIFAALVLMLRSLVAPLIMVASVLLTNVAALGLGWWISTHLFGFARFDSTTPLYAFVFLVALGIDYTIFLVTRARELARTQGTRRGITQALSVTGGVITSAGILLAAVFAALGVLPLVVLAQLGITVFVGVLLDTLIVRTVLVPALVQLLGERFWWPAHPAHPAQPSRGAHRDGESVSPRASRDENGSAVAPDPQGW